MIATFGPKPFSGAQISAPTSRSLDVKIVCLSHERLESSVDVRWLRQPKVNAVPQTSERFNPGNSWMIDPAPQPETGLQPRGMRHRAAKTNARLKDDPGLLRVHGDWTTRSRQPTPSIEQIADCARSAAKMIGQTIAATGMPEVLRDKPMAAFWAGPELFHDRISTSYKLARKQSVEWSFTMPTACMNA